MDPRTFSKYKGSILGKSAFRTFLVRTRPRSYALYMRHGKHFQPSSSSSGDTATNGQVVIGALRRLENFNFRSSRQATRIRSWERTPSELLVFFFSPFIPSPFSLPYDSVFICGNGLIFENFFDRVSNLIAGEPLLSASKYYAPWPQLIIILTLNA